MKPKQAKYLQSIDPALFNIHSSDINELVDNSQHSLPYPANSFWFPTPEGCGDPDSLAGIQKIIFAKIKFLEEQEKLNPSKNFECRKKFVSKFWCEQSVLTAQEKDQIEEFLVCFHEVFAQRIYDIDGIKQFRIRLTPVTLRPLYTQSSPTAFNLLEEFLVDLAMKINFGIITTPPYSKYSNPTPNIRVKEFLQN